MWNFSEYLLLLYRLFYHLQTIFLSLHIPLIILNYLKFFYHLLNPILLLFQCLQILFFLFFHHYQIHHFQYPYFFSLTLLSSFILLFLFVLFLSFPFILGLQWYYNLVLRIIYKFVIRSNVPPSYFQSFYYLIQFPNWYNRIPILPISFYHILRQYLNWEIDSISRILK